MMVADRYMRGFRTDLGQMVARPEHDGDLLQAELAAFIGQRPKPVPFGVSTSRSGIHMDNAREWAQPNAMKSAYTALADGQHLEFAGETAIGILSIRSAFGRQGASYAAVELERGIAGGHEITFEFGQLHETGAMLGTDISGAFGGDISSTTRFTRIGAAVALGNRPP